MSKIDTSSWKEFRLFELFETISKGNSLQVPTGANVKKKELVEQSIDDGGIPRITVSGVNNGIYGYYENRPNDANYRVYENFISVSFLGTVFYQKGKASLDMKVHCLKPLSHTLNDYTGQYIATVILASLREISYSDQISSTVLPHLSVKLPVDTKEEPDWVYMENYMRRVEARVSGSLPKLAVINTKEKTKIDTSSWKAFAIVDYFELSLPKGDIQVKGLQDGITPLITPSNINNGLIQRIPETSQSTLYDANCLTVDMFGNAYYQDEKFFVVAHGHVNVLRPKFAMTKHIGLFMCSVIKAMFMQKYGFTNMCTQKVLKAEKINLPTDANGEPNWVYMEQYMKNAEAKVVRAMDNLVS